MHTIPAYTEGVTLFTNDGKSQSFSSLRAALAALGLHWIKLNVGEHFCQFAGNDVRWAEGQPVCTPTYRYCYAVMRTSLGDVVTVADFEALCVKKRWPWYLAHLKCWNGEGPVPRTGKRRSGRWLRHLSTTNERRAAQPMDEDEPAPRPARNAHNLPNSWDDYTIAALKDRNWKRHRRTQWKPGRD